MSSKLENSLATEKGYSHNNKLEPPDKKNEVSKQERQTAQEEKAYPFNPRMLKRVRRADREHTYTGIAAKLNPLHSTPTPLSSDTDDETDWQELKKNRALHTTLALSPSSIAKLSLQNQQPYSSGSTRQVNATVESMEGHSSLASYSHHHQQIPHNSQDFQNAPSGNHPYYQQHHFVPGSSSGQQQQQHMMYGNEYDQHNQASTSSGPPQQHMHQQQYHHQQSHHYDQHTVRYEPLPPQPHSAPPQQRNFVPQYPVKIVDANTYGQINRTVNAPPPIVTKPLPPPAPPPSAPATMTTPRKTPPSFLKRQPDAQEQQRLDYEVAKNVSQIMSKNGMKLNQEPIPILPSPRPVPSQVPIPGKPAYQCTNCNRNLANARNLQRHRQTCGTNMISSSPLPNHPHQLTQQNAPQLAAMLQRSPPAPSTSAPPPQHHQAHTTPSTSTFQHHNSTGNMGMALAQQQQNALYSPQEMMNDPNAFFGVGFELKDDPLLFQAQPSSSLWPRDDSFHSEPGSAPHDQLDLSDPLGFNDPLHHMEILDTDNNKETPRDFQDSEELSTLDPNPQCHSQFYGGISLDPELEMPLSLDVDEPLTRSDSPSSQGTEAPMFQCDACKKTVQSERSLRRHYTTCKTYQAEAAITGEERPPPKRRGGNGGKRAKRAKLDVQDETMVPTASADQTLVPEKNSAILAALRKESTVQHGPPFQQPNSSYARLMANYNQPQFQSRPDVMSSGDPTHSQQSQNYMNRPPQSSNQPSAQQFQSSYSAPMPGNALPSISASWLSNNSNTSQGSSLDNSRSSSGIFTPPMASSTPIPSQKCSPLEELLNEDEPMADDDGDSRSSTGTSSTKLSGGQMYTCEHCARQLCSSSNLKRHRATCKAASLTLSVSNPSSQPATPAPEPAPLTVSTSQPPMETTAVVTYTKTNVTGGTNTWSNDLGQLVSPKQKIQPSAVVTHADTPITVSSTTGTPIKAALTVGEALRAQHHKQRLASIDSQQQNPPPPPQQQNIQMQAPMHQQQRYQHQMSQPNSNSMSPARIPPRPPNPILNQQQNPPQQQVHQQQIQQMASSRQAPISQHQITTQQLPQLPNSVLHSQLQLQSPPKKGIIELRHTDLVHITSEPLPAPAQERRGNYQVPPNIIPLQHQQHQQQQQHHQNGQHGPNEQMSFQGQPPQNHQDHMDQKRRSSEGQVGQSQMPLPPIQLPQRQPQQQQQPSQVAAAYQVQFNGRPLPPMQLPPKQNQQNVQNSQYQMNQQQQQHQQNQHQNYQVNQQQMHSNHPMNHDQQQHSMQMNSQHSQKMQHQQGPQNHQMPMAMQSPRIQPQQQNMNSMSQMNQHQQSQMPLQSPQFPQQHNQSHQMNQMNQQMQPQKFQSQQHSQMGQPQHSQPPQPIPRKISQPVDALPPPAKRGRSQSAAVPMLNNPTFHEAFVPMQEEFNPLDSPLDSIITTVPLSVEVANHHPAPGIVPEQSGQSSADSASVSMEPSPRVAAAKSHNQAYICPECDKIYSCRKNVKRHRMAVHKMTLEEVHAKPEQPATEEQAASMGQRRHTVAGTELDKSNSAVPKNAGAKRKASTAAMVAKKGKDKEVNIEKPTNEIATEPSSVAPPTNGSLPSAQTLMTLAKDPLVESQSPQESIAKVPTPPATAPTSTSDPPTQSSTPVPESVHVQTQNQHFFGDSQMSAQDRMVAPEQEPTSSFQSSQQVTQQDPALDRKPSAPTALPSLQLPPLQLRPLQEAVTSSIPAPTLSPSWPSVLMPNSAPSNVSTTRTFAKEEEVRAMAEIAAELKRSAECIPSMQEMAAKAEEEKHMSEDELILKRLQQGGVLEDVGDVSEYLNTVVREADSTYVEENERGQGPLPPLSSSSSVGLPSLSSPGEQQQQQQQYQQQYQQQPIQTWDDGGYPQHHQHYVQHQQENGYMHDPNMMQHQQGPINYEIHQDAYQSNDMMPQNMQMIPQNHQPSEQPQQFQEPQRPASQPVPAPRPARRTAPKTAADLTCQDCKRVLGSDYSLRRHRVKCPEAQHNRNPDYPRPPQRRASRKAAKITEAEVLASNPKKMDPQKLAERRAAVAEAKFEELEALSPPRIVFSVVEEIQQSLLDDKKRDKTTSPPPTEDQIASVPAPATPSSSSSSSSSSASSSVVSTTVGGVQTIQIQARNMCQECNKSFSSEWNLDRHRRETCPVTGKKHAYGPTEPSDEISLVFNDNSKRKLSRTLLRNVSSLISFRLDDSADRLELDTKWEHFELLLDVHTLKVAITADNVNLVAEQSKKYQLEEVVRMTEQFRWKQTPPITP